MKKLLFLLNSNPASGFQAQEGIEAVMAASVFEQNISVVFMGEGVNQLRKNQKTTELQRKNLAALISAFPLYDIDDVYAEKNSMNLHGIKDTVIDLNIASIDDVKKLVDKSDVVLSY